MSHANKIIELKKMLDEKLITQEEFIRMKQDLLNQQNSPGEPNEKPQKNFPHLNRNYQKMIPILFILLVIGIGVICFIFLNFKSGTKHNGELTNQDSSLSTFPPASYSFNQKEDYPVPVKKSYPLFQTHFNCMYSEFYPIGWSADGKFAYMSVSSGGIDDCKKVDIIIQDMVTDEVKYSLTSKLYCESSEVFSSAWSEMKNKFTSYLNVNKIEPDPGLKISSLPFIYNGNSYDFHLYNREGISQSFGIPCAAATVISLKINNTIDKKIFGKTYESSGPITNKVMGYLKSPFENRLAVLYVTEYPTNRAVGNVTFSFIGCEIN